MKNPKHSYKVEVVASQKENYSVLVETGTYNGDMVRAQIRNFAKIYSIELGDDLFDRADRQFRHIQNVTILHGDSPKVLKEIVPFLTSPALFWLDAHWSGGNTALGDKPCPILEELDVILDSPLKHGILIDDARCFGTLNGFPTLAEIEEKIGELKIVNDIIWKI